MVDKLGLPPNELEDWCRALKQALGCGGITLQRDNLRTHACRKRAEFACIGADVRS